VIVVTTSGVVNKTKYQSERRLQCHNTPQYNGPFGIVKKVKIGGVAHNVGLIKYVVGKGCIYIYD
jgi:hypothetical protein